MSFLVWMSMLPFISSPENVLFYEFRSWKVHSQWNNLRQTCTHNDTGLFPVSLYSWKHAMWTSLKPSQNFQLYHVISSAWSKTEETVSNSTQRRGQMIAVKKVWKYLVTSLINISDVTCFFIWAYQNSSRCIVIVHLTISIS